MTPGDFAKLSFNVIKQLDDFIPIQKEIDDIFDFIMAEALYLNQDKFEFPK